ncbi:MAG: N-acetylmuramoyl-L-alanine amidase [Phycisphaerae bacterium]|nr:N-acetylmuramoyl-L-alanine amidase [Phycisphaerae bacterium]
MSAHAVRHKYRHYRTLAVLVFAMTGGTMLLFWLGQFAPVTPLRSTAASGRQWSQIAVRAESRAAARGFFHYRIDEAGQLYQSYAWKAGQYEQSSPKTVHILLTCPDAQARVTELQARTLGQLISRLRTDHAIAADRVFVDAAKGIVDRGEVETSRLRRT